MIRARRSGIQRRAAHRFQETGLGHPFRMARILLVLVGLILLTPGLCTLAVLVPSLPMASGRDVREMAIYAIPLIALTALLAWGGVVLIRIGVRNDRRPPAP
jgi:hypothetical protein